MVIRSNRSGKYFITANRRISIYEQNRINRSSGREGRNFQKDSEKALKAFIDVVTDELKNGEKIQLVGFGTLK